jgi:hypothetical protein
MMVPTRLTTLESDEYSGTPSIDAAIMARKPARCTSCGIVMLFPHEGNNLNT